MQTGILCAAEKQEEVQGIDPSEMKVDGLQVTPRPFMVPVVKQDEVVAYLVISITMTLTDAQKLNHYTESLPKVRHDMFLYLYELFGVLWTPAANPNAAQIRDHLEAIAKQYVAEDFSDLRINTMNVHALKNYEGQVKPFFVPQVVNP